MTPSSRRAFINSGLLLFTALFAADALAGPRRRRRIKRRIKRRMRRRFRRRVSWRTVGARRALLVPVGLAVGWELAVAAATAGQPDVVVVVRELKVVDGQHIALAVAPDGSVQEFAIDREDTKDNTVSLPGSELALTDTGTPAVESEIEEEQELDE